MIALEDGDDEAELVADLSFLAEVVKGSPTLRKLEMTGDRWREDDEEFVSILRQSVAEWELGSLKTIMLRDAFAFGDAELLFEWEEELERIGVRLE